MSKTPFQNSCNCSTDVGGELEGNTKLENNFLTKIIKCSTFYWIKLELYFPYFTEKYDMQQHTKLVQLQFQLHKHQIVYSPRLSVYTNIKVVYISVGT